MDLASADENLKDEDTKLKDHGAFYSESGVRVKLGRHGTLQIDGGAVSKAGAYEVERL